MDQQKEESLLDSDSPLYRSACSGLAYENPLAAGSVSALVFRTRTIRCKEPGFITGSRAYGTPRENSDVDLVVLISYADLKWMANVAKEQGKKIEDKRSDPSDQTGGLSSGSFYFGEVNLIVCANQRYYKIWKEGTEHLKTMKPVTRDFAVQYFKEKRNE